MPENIGSFENRSIRMSGSYKATDIRLKSAKVVEGINALTHATVEFITKDKVLDLKSIVGCTMDLEMDCAKEGTVRTFRGTCISAECVGTFMGFGLFVAEVRPWLWFLTRGHSCRVYQGKSTPDIVQAILSDYGYSANFKKRLTNAYLPRDFCIQYRETDLDFINRLMEEDGIYYYFTHDGTRELMVLGDGIGAHDALQGSPTLDFIEPESDYRKDKDHVFEWSDVENATTGKVTLTDYNFEKPRPVPKATRDMVKGSFTGNDRERYEHPGRFRDAEEAKRLTQIKLEAEAIRHMRWRGVGTARALAVGRTFKLSGHARTQDSVEFLVIQATHYMQVELELAAEPVASALGDRIDMGPAGKDTYRVFFEAVPKREQYRAPQITPWPEIASIQTAVVVGPAGEEIHTDKFGRVRIQFHWDRVGKNDDKSSVWVRTMMPWTGKNWGMIAIPRIGQEVVVQFEDGNPDRPVVIGMLYNGDTMPPYDLPANMTQSGVKTNSTKGGKGFNELMFEDKKGSELVRMTAEKDFTQIVNNNSVITVGVDAKKTEGDMTMTVLHNLTETVKTGDHTFTVETGKQTITIETDKIEEIKGKSDLTVTGNVTTTVKTGNVSETVETGHVTHAIKVGNETTTLDMGNVTIDVKLGKIEMKAMQEISLKVGGNSVVINQMGVTVKGIMVNVEGTAMLEAKAPMTQVKGTGLLVLKGGITMIN